MLCRVLVQEGALFKEGEVGRFRCYDDEKRVWDFGGAATMRGVVACGFDLVSTYLVPLDYSLCRRVGHDCGHVNHLQSDRRGQRAVAAAVKSSWKAGSRRSNDARDASSTSNGVLSRQTIYACEHVLDEQGATTMPDTDSDSSVALIRDCVGS
jgi:hypothetical protein